MSREIKFRAWDGEKYWYNIAPSPLPSPTLDICKKITDYEPEYYNMVDIIESVEAIEQYTGLKDKNGKEIYEGDIIYDIYTGDEVFIVGWDKDKAGFMLADTADYPMAYFDEYELDKDLEIIGNVHENPELLEGEK